MEQSDGRTDDEELYALLDDEYARRILVETYGDARSAEALSDACDASESTIYRRVERLRERDLIEGIQRLDPGGHHHEVYAARLERVTVELTDDGLVVDVDYAEEHAADRFTRLYEELSG
ncbi:helix-turn-helix domain-containing protein [Salinirubellus sp. GCM10025818]|jgi:DNA-binding Lrp family transcriptional regulator|uniref:helix-turn-helix domain-containing protein n=1 Tax=Salinirubellus TaxID=2162630 RepID=UPI0030CFBCB8